MEFKALPMPELILFGGAFDPPHEGHRLVLERVHGVFPEAKIWVIPGQQPAVAGGTYKTTGATFGQRVEMCRLAFQDQIREGYLEIDPIESELPLPNFTIQTLRELEKRYSHKSWGLVIGRDQLERFAEWREPIEILKRVSLIVVERDSSRDLGEAIGQLAVRLGLTAIAEREDAWRWQELGSRVFPLQGVVSPAASRMIREDLGKAKEHAWLNGKVANYIESHRLYKTNEALYGN